MRFVVLLTQLTAILIIWSGASHAQAPSCREGVDFGQAHVSCVYQKDDLRTRTNSPSDPYVYRVEIICSTTAGGGITIGGCGTPEACRPPDPVYRYTVYRAPRGTTT